MQSFAWDGEYDPDEPYLRALEEEEALAHLSSLEIARGLEEDREEEPPLPIEDDDEIIRRFEQVREERIQRMARAIKALLLYQQHLISRLCPYDQESLSRPQVYLERCVEELLRLVRSVN